MDIHKIEVNHLNKLEKAINEWDYQNASKIFSTIQDPNTICKGKRIVVRGLKLLIDQIRRCTGGINTKSKVKQYSEFNLALKNIDGAIKVFEKSEETPGEYWIEEILEMETPKDESDPKKIEKEID